MHAQYYDLIRDELEAARETKMPQVVERLYWMLDFIWPRLTPEEREYRKDPNEW